MNLLWKRKNESDVQIILCMIYTGVRITQVPNYEKDSVMDKKYMTGGIKTKAGKNRPIPLADKFIVQIISAETRAISSHAAQRTRI